MLGYCTALKCVSYTDGRAERLKRKESEEENTCAYCEHAVPVNHAEAFLCDYKGVVRPEGHCRRFVFDLLKVSPRRRTISGSDDLDFSV